MLVGEINRRAEFHPAILNSAVGRRLGTLYAGIKILSIASFQEAAVAGFISGRDNASASNSGADFQLIGLMAPVSRIPALIISRLHRRQIPCFDASATLP